MDGKDEIGMAEYDIRKLLRRKNLKFSTWLDLKHEGHLDGKLGCCIYLELDILKDVRADIYHRTEEETKRLYLLHKTTRDLYRKTEREIGNKFKLAKMKFDYYKRT